MTIVNQPGCCARLYSAPIFLVAGMPYYMEALYENGTGGDYLHVQWKPPGASAFSQIPANNIGFCVTNDLIKPVLLGASANPEPNKVTVRFSKPMADSAIDPNAGSYALITGGNTPLNVIGAALVNDNKSVILTLDGNLAQGTVYTLTVGGAGVNDRTFNANHLDPDPSSAQFSGLAVTPGVVVRQIWYNLSGPNVLGTLTNNARYPCQPDVVDTLDTMFHPEPAGSPDNYGVRLTSYIIPPETANYQFQLRSDDSGRILLGLDGSPASKVSIVQQDGSCCNESLFSPVIRLIGGMAYPIEALMQEGGGGDYLEVKWKNNASIPAYVDIPAANLANAIDPSTVTITLNSGPADTTVTECRTATFSVSASVSCGGGALSYQWYHGANPIAGATGPVLTWPAQMADDQTTFWCQLCVPGKCVATGNAVLTVLPDTTEPLLVKAQGSASLQHILLTFSENVDVVTAGAPENYVVSHNNQPHGNNGGFPLSVAVNGDKVTLTVDPLAQGELYTVVVNNVRDQCLHNIVPIDSSASFHAWVLSQGLVLRQIWRDLSNHPCNCDADNKLSLLTNDVRYPCDPNINEWVNVFDITEPDGAYNWDGGRLRGYIIPPVTGAYTFSELSDDAGLVSLSLTGNPNDKQTLIYQPGCCSTLFSAPVNLVAGQYYYLEAIYENGTGGDYIHVQWQPPGAADFSAIPDTNLGYALDPDVSPSITCPQNINAECGVPVDFVAKACDPLEGTLAAVCNPPSGSRFPAGPTTVTCTARNGSGNAATCSFTVTTTDTLAPVLTCPPNTLLVDACSNPNGTTVVLPVSAVDACEGNVAVVCDPPSGSFFPIGSTPVTCQACDSLQHCNRCTFTVTVREGDLTPPAITCPQNVVAECQGPNGTIVQYPPATAVDNCDPNPTVGCLPPSGSSFPLGVTTVTCTATDAANNSSTCTFTVTVRDTRPPDILDCNDKVVRGCPEAQTTVQYSPIAIDLCGTASISCDPPSGSVFPCGNTTVTCTATDERQNSARCTFTVTVDCSRPTLRHSVNGSTLTLTWPSSPCYRLHTRADLAPPVVDNAKLLDWTPYGGTVTDDGTTSTAIIQIPSQGNLFYLLK